MDGYLVQSIFEDHHPTPSESFSEFLGKQVLLVMKGPQPRPLNGTESHPELQGTAAFQDGYPILVASEDSLADLQVRLGRLSVPAKKLG